MDLFSIIFFAVGIPLTVLTAIYAHSMVMYARGDLAQQRGKYDLAVERFQRAARGRNPIGRGVALAALARVYLRLDRPDETLAALREAVGRSRTPAIVLAIYQLFVDAALHAKAADPAGILREAEQLLGATRMPPALKAVVHGQMSGGWYRLGNIEDAERLARLALSHDSLNPAALFTLGWIRLASGDTQDAAENFTTLTNVSQSDQRPLGLYGQGVTAFYEGRLDAADEFFARAVKQGGLILEPFACARLAMVKSLGNKDPYPTLKHADEALQKLAKHGTVKDDSGIYWQLAMAKAYAEDNPRAGKLAAEAAPRHERREADRLAQILETKKPVAGWL